MSSDADKIPTVTVHTAKSGSVTAILSDEQPYEDLNKITRVDKYLYEIPISSDETFLMIIVTEEKGTIENTVQAAVHTTECSSTTVISDIPQDEFDKVSFEIPRIYDVKFQIENGTKHKADESEFLYLDEQELNITAIIDSQSPPKRVELRTITLGQSDDEYIAMRMNVEALPISDTAYLISGSIPSFLMQDPAIVYWIHVIDEELNEVESKHYTIGVRPVSEPDVSLELDVPSVRQSSSILRPSLYINNDKSPAYGIVSLIVDGKIISKKTQFIDVGQTKVPFAWNVPDSMGISSYDIQGKVDLYGESKITKAAQLYTYPRTISMSAYDLKPIKPVEKEGKVLAEPVLLYASDPNNGHFKFRVVAPNGQCIIGPSDECKIQDSTRELRGGLASIEYNGQILRVKYSGPDSPLERFSITSVDPIVGNWTVTLETDEGILPQVQALKETEVKIKHRLISETITVYSD